MSPKFTRITGLGKWGEVQFSDSLAYWGNSRPVRQLVSKNNEWTVPEKHHMNLFSALLIHTYIDR